VSARDSFGAPVPGVAVQGPRGQSSTDAQGASLVALDSPEASATVSLTHEDFIPATVPVSGMAGQVREFVVTLERLTAAAGGSLGSRSGNAPIVDVTGQQLSFEIELVVVDGKSQAITNLVAGDFALRPCTPLASTDDYDCVNGMGSNVDIAYTPASAQPESLTPIAGAPVVPFAAALLLDQSGSMAETDPTGARLYSTKTFLQRLGANDQVLLATFASTSGAKIPTPPLTVYAPFRNLDSAVADYFPTLDALASQVGGDTPLYDSVDGLRQQMATTVLPPAGLSKAMIILSDGADTTCISVDPCRLARDRTIQGARQDGVRLLTIGMSGRVDVTTLGELANQTGGAFLYAKNTQQLLSVYGSVGNLISLSLPTYRLRWTVSAATAGAFLSGNKLLGQVQVTVGQSSFDVPFIVGIP
jgi:hypothetical protein